MKKRPKGSPLPSSELVCVLLGTGTGGDAQQCDGGHDNNREDSTITGRLLFDDDPRDNYDVQFTTSHYQFADADQVEAVTGPATTELVPQEKNTYLSERLVDVKQRLHATFACLQSRIASLARKGKEQHRVDSSSMNTQDIALTSVVKDQGSQTTRTENARGLENSTSWKQRINAENSEVSRQLTDVILHF